MNQQQNEYRYTYASVVMGQPSTCCNTSKNVSRMLGTARGGTCVGPGRNLRFQSDDAPVAVQHGEEGDGRLLRGAEPQHDAPEHDHAEKCVAEEDREHGGHVLGAGGGEKLDGVCGAVDVPPLQHSLGGKEGLHRRCHRTFSTRGPARFMVRTRM